jgi:hypothetical protein
LEIGLYLELGIWLLEFKRYGTDEIMGYKEIKEAEW